MLPLTISFATVHNLTCWKQCWKLLRSLGACRSREELVRAREGATSIPCAHGAFVSLTQCSSISTYDIRVLVEAASISFVKTVVTPPVFDMASISVDSELISDASRKSTTHPTCRIATIVDVQQCRVISNTTSRQPNPETWKVYTAVLIPVT
jgi:hypothetical protein